MSPRPGCKNLGRGNKVNYPRPSTHESSKFFFQKIFSENFPRKTPAMRAMFIEQNFQEALDNLPDNTGYDPFSHKNVADLCWVCLHELDLHSEGEYWHDAVARRNYLKFIEKYGEQAIKMEAQIVFEKGKTKKRGDFC